MIHTTQHTSPRTAETTSRRRWVHRPTVDFTRPRLLTHPVGARIVASNWTGLARPVRGR
jgi:hypothetical protein